MTQGKRRYFRAPRTSVRRGMVALAVPAIAASVLIAPAAAQQDEAAASTRASSGVIISGKRWLGGKGVDVLRGRQCTELATRLYGAKRWGPLDNIYGLRSGRKYGRVIQFHRNGSGYRPVPGDVLVELGGSYQHVAVVNRVTKKAIFTLEQNATPSGRHKYRWNGRRATGAYGVRYVGGFIHSDRNHKPRAARNKPRAAR